MKITDIEILLINTNTGSLTKEGKKKAWRPIIVKINTDEGISGYGEVGMCYGVGAAGGWGMAKEFARLLIGMDPMDNEKIWNKIMVKTFWGQGGGTAVFGGMSGIDIALWDIKGKALGAPIYKLLGGKSNDELRVYASQIQFDWGPQERNLIHKEEYAEAALRAVEEGYDCVKVDLMEVDYDGGVKQLDLRGYLPNHIVKMACERLEAIRLAVGDDVDIIIENHAETDVTSAVQLAKHFEPYNIMCLEEATTPLNTDLFKQLKQKINIPLAGGERIYSRWGYYPFFKDRTLDLIQPDLGTVGGLSEGKKVADMAHMFDIRVQAHVCGSPIAKAAALHFETSIPNFCIHEHHRTALIKENVELCVHNYQPVNGKYKVPELPGLGQELTERAYELADKVVIK